jgi:hypothetical protein
MSVAWIVKPDSSSFSLGQNMKGWLWLWISISASCPISFFGDGSAFWQRERSFANDYDLLDFGRKRLDSRKK